jgi:sugar phosphate isomerase/epimerase
MAAIQPRRRFDQASDVSESPGSVGSLPGRLGLSVPHEWWPSAHLLKSYEAAGFSHVQVDAPPVSVLGDRRLVMLHAHALRESLATTALSLILHAPAGLRLGAIGTDRAMHGLIDYAVESRAEQVVYHALALVDEQESEGELRFEMRSIREAIRRAELNGLVIALENLAPLFPGPETISANPMSLRTAVRRLSSEGVGVCLDLGHAHIAAELRHTSIARQIEPVMDAVTLIHAHDNFGARHNAASDRALGVDPLRLDLHLPPGRGTVPWPEVAPLVGRTDTPVILEVHPPFRPRVAELYDSGSLALATA